MFHIWVYQTDFTCERVYKISLCPHHKTKTTTTSNKHTKKKLSPSLHQTEREIFLLLGMWKIIITELRLGNVTNHLTFKRLEKQ